MSADQPPDLVREARRQEQDSGGDTQEQQQHQQPPSPSAASALAPETEAQPSRHEEYQYLDLVSRVLSQGVRRADRTGTGTRALFGHLSRYSLSGGQVPLLTTKRVFWRGIVGELLWFLRGRTDAALLSAQGIKIWEANASRAALDARGFTHRRQGDLGPVYGFQWRHFGAKYLDCDTDYSGQGVDQLAQVIRMIREEPESRRIVMTAWNPCDLPLMALPPCHCFLQFFVDTGCRQLSCMLTQRSADLGLGVPFNLASYGLLTHLIARVTDLTPGFLVHSIGDAHVYSNHESQLRVQLTRTPNPFPRISIDVPIQSLTDIEALTIEDIRLVGYDPHPAIHLPMSV